MYTCNHCKKKFTNEPFICSNKRKYCSMECIPDSVMDKPYSFQYFNLVENIRDIKSRISNIERLDDRIDLENEVTDLHTSYIIDMWGDDEGLYYKRQILILLPTLDTFYDNIHNIFMQRKIQLRRATIICWDYLLQTIGKEIYDMIFSYFQSEMESVPYENVYSYYISSDRCKELGCFKDKLCVSTLKQAKAIKNIYYKSFNHFKSLLTQKQLETLSDSDDCVYIHTLAYCVVCNEWEDWDDFSFDKNLNLYKCGQWNDCRKYDDYYKD